LEILAGGLGDEVWSDYSGILVSFLAPSPHLFCVHCTGSGGEGPMVGDNANSDAVVRSKMMKNDDKGTSEPTPPT
jgi:hypothetical protein